MKGWNACTWVGVICVAILAAGMVGCIAVIGLFGSAASSVSKQMQATADKSSNPEKYTAKPSGIDLISAKVEADRFGYLQLKVTVKNNGTKAAKAVAVNVKTQDAFGKSGFADESRLAVVDSDDAPLKPGKTASGSFTHIGSKVVAESKVVEVVFDDGTKWPDDYYTTEPSAAKP